MSELEALLIQLGEKVSLEFILAAIQLLAGKIAAATPAQKAALKL